MSLASMLYKKESKSHDAFITTSYSDDSITRGYGFQVQRVHSIPQGITKAVIRTSLLDNNSKTAFFLPLIMGTDAGEIIVKSYKIDPGNFTGGTVYNAINVNEFSQNVADIVCVFGVTSTAVPGIDVREYLVGIRSTNQFAGGGSGNSDIPKVNKADKDIMLELNHPDTGTINFVCGIIWFELPVPGNYFV